MAELYDAVVVGGGPAGLTAALYLARARHRVLVVEQDAFGGQIAITDEVVNYPAVLKTDGKTLTATMRRQAEAFGAEFLLAQVTDFDFSEDMKTLRTNHGDFNALSVILATGAHPRSVGFVGEAEHKGRGVAYCATCDGELFTGRDLLVVGGGFAAAEEAVFLTKFARSVTILIRGADFSCAAAVAEEARRQAKITVLTHTVLEEVRGEAGLTYARWRNTETGEVTELERTPEDFFGVFVFAGYSPASELFRGQVATDEQGYILTDKQQKTDRAGVFAAGDVCVKPLRQVVTAVGDGATAATEAAKYIAAVKRKGGYDVPPPRPVSAPNSPVSGPSSALDPPSFAPDSPAFGLDPSPIPPEMEGELRGLFGQMKEPLTLKLVLDGRAVSRELEVFCDALAALGEKISVTKSPEAASEFAPFVEICGNDGKSFGLRFHGVPAGHEFTSFVLALYRASGAGEPLAEELKNRVKRIEKPLDVQIFVTLSCTLCPDLVAAAQRLAPENPRISVDIFDLKHFETLKNRHKIMSVPCMLVNGSSPYFGKKSMEEVLSIWEENG